ncbi:unnamed protein product [Euphydryas editha]|uniref:Uncharacterized protein n=1 Tax=Euphydryas editha TaxID=104508 RepID=A0AAU9TZI8_EUPED|nr:unnamed protein product [Euphydryas editha]
MSKNRKQLNKRHLVNTCNKYVEEISEYKIKHNNPHLQQEQTKIDLVVNEKQQLQSNDLKSEVARFIEISKYFSNPLQKTASYVCEILLVSYTNLYQIEYKRGGITTQHIPFSNMTLEPVYLKLYKLIPDVEHIKFNNLSLSRCKRIPPGLSFNLGLVFDDLNETLLRNLKLIFVASRATTTPCYQICEINVLLKPQKVKLVTV